MLLAALAALFTTAGVAGLGTLASGYSSTQTPSGLNVTTGSVSIASGGTNRLTAAVSNLEPGDTITRAIDLVTSGNLLSSATLTTTDTYGDSQLSTATTGLQMTVEWCSVPWTEHGTTPAYTYDACAGTHTILSANGDILRSASLSGLNAENSGSTLPTTDHLLITVALPSSSPSSAQSAGSIINYTFTGLQPTAAKAR